LLSVSNYHVNFSYPHHIPYERLVVFGNRFFMLSTRLYIYSRPGGHCGENAGRKGFGRWFSVRAAPFWSHLFYYESGSMFMKVAPYAQPMVSRHETASCASTAPPRMVRNFFKLSSGHLLPPKLPPLLSYTSSLPNGRYLLQVCRLVTHPPYRISNSFSHQVKLIGRRHMNCLRKKTGCHRSR
jgi:hypothetical protein